MSDPVIDIDSEEDEADTGVDGDAECGPAAKEALAAEPVRDHLICQLLVPPNTGLKPQPVGQVCLWLDCTICEEPCGGCEIHISRHPEETDDTICIPIDSVCSAQVETAGADGPTVLLSMSPPLVAVGFLDDFLASVGSMTPYPPDPETGSPMRPFSAVAFTTGAEDVRAMLATFKRWIRPMTLYGPRSLGLAEEIPLQLRGTVLDGRDISLLEDDRWLNDAVLDFFFRLVVEIAIPPELTGRVHVAKTQFLTRLTACSAASGEAGWENVKTWTRSVAGGISSQSYIVYPVNDQNCHWWIAIVCHPHRAMELGGMPSIGGDTANDMPRIVCLDPAAQPMPKEKTLEYMKGYLRRELFNNPTGDDSDKDKMEYQVKRWKAAVVGLGKMEAAEPEVPLQMNPYDCGVFSLEYFNHLLRHPSFLPELGMKSHHQWFHQGLVTHRRQRMREIIALLQDEAQSLGQGDVVMLLKNERIRTAVVAALTDEPELEPPPGSENVAQRQHDGTTPFAPCTDKAAGAPEMSEFMLAGMQAAKLLLQNDETSSEEEKENTGPPPPKMDFHSSAPRDFPASGGYPAEKRPRIGGAPL